MAAPAAAEPAAEEPAALASDFAADVAAALVDDESEAVLLEEQAAVNAANAATAVTAKTRVAGLKRVVRE